MPDRRYDDGNGLPSLWLQDVIDRRIRWLMMDGGTAETFQPGSIPESAIEPNELVTDLPNIGYDGQKVSVLVSEDAGWVWDFVYRASHSGEHKWFYRGGSPMTHRVTTLESTTSTTYTDLATVGPEVEVPLPGVYKVEIACTMSNSDDKAIGFMAPRVESNTPSNDDSIRFTSSTADAQGSPARPLANYLTTTAADQTISAQYRVNGGTGSFFNRDIVVTPVRVRKAG